VVNAGLSSAGLATICKKCHNPIKKDPVEAKIANHGPNLLVLFPKDSNTAALSAGSAITAAITLFLFLLPTKQTCFIH
jgi:hypothetical protein